MKNFFFIFLIYKIGASIELPTEEQFVSEASPMIHDSENKDCRINTFLDQEEKKSFIQRGFMTQEESQSNTVIEFENMAKDNESVKSSRLNKKTMLENNAMMSIDDQNLIWKFLLWYNGLLLLFLLFLLILAIFTIVYFFIIKEDYFTGTLVMGFIISVGILASYIGWNIEKSIREK